jgi:CubicO group peptidase (beta-lactamase class C family)
MRVVLHALVVFFVAVSSFAQEAAKLDEVVQPYVRDKTFMGSVLVARGGSVILSKGYGSANLEWDVANTPATKFRIGSITKQFTAASILLLAERGKLTLDDPIKKYVAEAPAAWDRITLHHLLTHTSGIPNFTALPEYHANEPFETPPAKTITMVRARPLDFAPGEKMVYSNSGYVLLGYVIEKASGISYERFLQDNIFTPLGMKDSGYDSNSRIIAHRASGYAPSPDGPINAAFVHMSVPYAAGGLYSTTEDLLRWEQGLFGGKVMSAASLEKMLTPFKNNYALGLLVRTVDGRKVVQHNGGINGFSSFLAYYPDDKLTVAVLGNLNGAAPGAIAGRLGTVAHGGTVQTPTARKEIELPASALEKFVGTYDLSGMSTLWIRLDGDHLTAQIQGQPQVRIFAEAERKFFFKVVDADIDFEANAAGETTGLVLHQNGMDVNAARKSKEIVGEVKHTEVAVPAETLAKYAGTYQMRPGIYLGVTLEGDHLMAQLTGQPKFPIFAESPTVFFYRVVEATLEFQIDGSGTTTGVRLRQGPMNALMLRAEPRP